MRLLNMTLSRFMGIKSFVFEPNGKDCSVFAANGVGKTTLSSAYTFLLTGKDADGNTDFSIKSLDAKGEVLKHGVEHSVEGVFASGGREVTLKRSFSEVWTNRRGSATAVFDGHATKYTVDGIDRDKRTYEEAVASLLEEK